MIYGFNANEVFKIGIEIEENGKRFYDRVLDMTEESGVKDLFRRLAAAEVEHKARFQAWQEALPPSARENTVWDPENETDQYLKMMADMHVFKSNQPFDEVMAGIQSVEDALRLAMQFEKDSIVFFLAVQESTEEKKGKELIGQLVDEEKEHLKSLSMELKRVLESKNRS